MMSGPQRHQDHIQFNAQKSENPQPSWGDRRPATPLPPPPVISRSWNLPGKPEKVSYLKAPQGPDNSFPLFQRRKAQHLDSLLWI